MSFEIIILPYSWFHNEITPTKFDNFKSLINKSYDKPRHKYGIIKSSRLNKNHSLLDDLAIKISDQINIYLLLVKKEAFESLNVNRQFTGDIDQCYNCDIPPVLPYSDIAKSSMHVVNSRFEFNEDILQRCVASVGLKSNHYHSDSQTIANFELTCFTSFMRNIAPVYLEHVLSLIKHEFFFNLLNNTGGFNVEETGNYKKIIIYADVIVEHDLVDYYINKCNFEKTGNKDLLIEVNKETGDAGGFGLLEDGILASRDFHLGFLKRELKLKKKADYKFVSDLMGTNGMTIMPEWK
ncbi:unnamed protein product [Candida verbasci]|uniref:Uncharacterized protein n=1 Tax=Candida verbasci TaxID=1227364 RepID=A0A9W4TXX3_9ASCO|nr:unnamed protein product [Candida verbasci]